MFLPILLSLGLLGASATSVGNGNCPTDEELLQPFTQTSESFDLTWFQNAQKECTNGNCEDVARTIFRVADQTKKSFADRFWLATNSLGCRTDWSIYKDDCVKYNMPVNEANDVINSYGGFDGLCANQDKLLKKRNELLYRVGWYKDPEFENCKQEPQTENATPDDPEMTETTVEEVEVNAPQQISEENSLSEIELQASLFAQKQKTDDTMLKILTNTLETHSDTVEETTSVVDEATVGSSVEKTTTIEAQSESESEAEAEPENQENKSASKSWWKFWQRRAT